MRGWRIERERAEAFVVRPGARPGGRGARVAFVVNGTAESAMAVRARALAVRLESTVSVSVLYRDGTRAGTFQRHLRALHRARPHAVYIFDIGVAGVIAVLAYRALRRCPVVIETGDAVAHLLRSTRRIGRVGYQFVSVYERGALNAADAVVVRGTLHKQYLESLGIRVAAVVPDGVDTRLFRRFEVPEVRRSLGLDGAITVGVLGSIHWNARLRWTTGLELVEALAELRGEDRLTGLIVGEGSGLPALVARAADLRVDGRVRVVAGWRPLEQLPELVNCMDVCLSTQTNDLVGRVRTTGKLPLFLACGRFVLASRVGEAARVLPEEMLVEYAPEFDAKYPARLAARLHELVENRDRLGSGDRSREIAEREFDYAVLAPRVAKVIESLLRRGA